MNCSHCGKDLSLSVYNKDKTFLVLERVFWGNPFLFILSIRKGG